MLFRSLSKFQLNIGFEDNLTKRELMKLINRLGVARGIEIGLIDIASKDTIVELDSYYSSQLMRALNRAKYSGVPIQARLLENKKSRQHNK